MTNPEFVKWLAGFFELADDPSLTRHQLYVISNHLNLAEAVEGALGEFNQRIRADVMAQIEMLDEPEDKADPAFVNELKERVIKQAGLI